MLGIAAIVLLYVTVAFVFAFVGYQAVKAWREIELRRFEKVQAEVTDEVRKDIEELRSKMNSLQAAKAFRKT